MTHQLNPYWNEGRTASHFPALKSKERVDVAIIGAGIAGLSTAIHLKLAGKTVAVIDQYCIGAGDTGRTTAHITEIIDRRYRDIISNFGIKQARQIARACKSANDLIAYWVNEWDLACDYERLPGFLYTSNEKELSNLEDELAALKEVGFNCEWTNAIPLPFKTHGGIRVENQAQFHPRKYVEALGKKVPGNGSHIFENTRAIEVHEGEPCRVITDQGEIIAGAVVDATYSPEFNGIFITTKFAAYRTYAIAFHRKERLSLKGLFWDTADPYHYIRNYKDVWIVGGGDHKTGMKASSQEGFMHLVEYARMHLGAAPLLSKWSGQILEPLDGLPYIGLTSRFKHTYMASGFSGNGMTFGSLSGMLISDLILKRENPWVEIFKPTRISPVSSFRNFISENKDYPLCLIKDHLLRRNKLSLEDLASLPNGEGGVVSQDGQEVAVYRENANEFHAVSAVCPHMGCQVHWNKFEKTWDCPCHGSRFSTKGQILNGPANKGLKPVPFYLKETKKKGNRAA